MKFRSEKELSLFVQRHYTSLRLTKRVDVHVWLTQITAQKMLMKVSNMYTPLPYDPDLLPALAQYLCAKQIVDVDGWGEGAKAATTLGVAFGYRLEAHA